MSEYEEWGVLAYKTYGDTVGWKNFMGNPMPQWEDLTGPIKSGWCEAAQAVKEKFKDNSIGYCQECRLYPVSFDGFCPVCGNRLEM